MSHAPVRGLDAPRTPIVERAYQLARSGRCRTLQEICRILEQEGYRDVTRHLGGRSIKNDLRRLRDAARAMPAAT